MMFLIVDADGLCFRSFYALEAKVDFPLAYGVPRSAARLIKEFEPERMVLVFDSEDDELKKIYPRYREGREEPWDFGMTDYVYMLEILSYLGFEVYKDGREADRIIASFVNRDEESEICIYSDDKDFFQLLEGRRVWMFGEHRGEVFARDVKEEFELPNNRLFRELLIFTGDAVDRIPRILKTEDAYKVIWEKGFLEDWFFDEDFSGLEEGIIKELEEKYGEIVRNYKLVNLLDETRKPGRYEAGFSEEKIKKVLKKVGLDEREVERIQDLVRGRALL